MLSVNHLPRVRTVWGTETVALHTHRTLKDADGNPVRDGDFVKTEHVSMLVGLQRLLAHDAVSRSLSAIHADAALSMSTVAITIEIPGVTESESADRDQMVSLVRAVWWGETVAAL
ncbi:MAG TPA: hypothetical protein VLT45_15540 [Kofleriaceae bacterium]|nr:hypothetical protein [Kofleriaceae bacterium]